MSLEQKRIINQFIAEFGFDPFSLPGRQDKLREALERIADPRNIHFAGDAQVVAREALEQQDAQASRSPPDTPNLH